MHATGMTLGRKRFVVLGIPAKVLRIAQALFPNLTLASLRQVSRFLPPPKGLPEQIPVVGRDLRRQTRAPVRRPRTRKIRRA